MRRFALLVILSFFVLNVPAPAQTTPQRDQQATRLLQESLAALSGVTSIQDVTLSGTVRRIAGSLDEPGTITMKGTSLGQERVDMDLPSGPRSEVRNLAAGQPTGSWSGPAGTWHSMANHNLWTDPTWFFPTFLLARALSSTNYAISPADKETMSGAAVEHVSISQAYSGSQEFPSFFQYLSKMDIYLNARSSLPAAVAFNIHPDQNALANIPIRVEFSDYRLTQGAMVPLHIQEYLQNGLVLDVSVTQVQINSGLSATDFQSQ